MSVFDKPKQPPKGERYVPKYMALDFETARIMPDGKEQSSTSAWHPDFRVTSMALFWDKPRFTGQKYVKGEKAVGRVLKRIMRDRIKLVVHNANFEIKVLMARFPWFDTNLVVYDTMRAYRFLDGGVGIDTSAPGAMTIEDQINRLQHGESKPSGERLHSGVSLGACYARTHYMRNKTKKGANFKDEHYKKLRDKGVRRGQEGKNLHLFTDDEMALYNIADAKATYNLFVYSVAAVQAHKKDSCQYPRTPLWARDPADFGEDMKEHLAICRQIAKSSLEGVYVDVEQAKAAIEEIKAEIKKINRAFWAEVKEYAHPIRMARVKAWVNEPKTMKGKLNRKKRWEEQRWKVAGGKLNFNPGSTQQLAHLFCDVMGIKPKFWTVPSKGCKNKDSFVPKPSMASHHLPSYGKAGEILANRGKKMKHLKDAEKLLELASHDGRWHFGLNPCGTNSGRYSNSSDADMPSLNIQGMPRRIKSLMSSIISDDGHTFVSADLTAGEPTVTAAHVADGNFKLINFGMAGKEPYYSPEGVLLLDDLYIAGGSVHPADKGLVKELFNTRFKGSDFAGQWLDDKEVIKNEIKAKRSQWKTAMLAMQYGQGAEGMRKQAEKEGIYLSSADAKGFRHAYWNQLFPEVNDFKKALVRRFKERGYLINPFGFKLNPESDHKVMNYFIQSTVTSIMKTIEIDFFKRAPWCYYKATIHDEILFECPDDRLAEAKALYTQVVGDLNKNLMGPMRWKVPVKTGWVEGKNFYDAK